LQQRLAAKPVDQVIGIRCLEQRGYPVFRLITADPGIDRQKMQIVVAQHHPYIVAQRFYKAQNVKRAWTASYQVTRQPERVLARRKVDLL
jgi:hypothetical protein